MPSADPPGRPTLLAAIAEAGRENSTATVLFHAAVAERAGLGPSDHKALDVLLRVGPMTAGELAERVGLTSASVTALVSRLEARGFVRRTQDVQDRRRVIIEPVLEGLDVLRRSFDVIQETLPALLASYSDVELATLLDFLVRSAAMMREAAQELHQQAP